MPQDSYHKGAVAELAKDFNKAFRMYVKATEQYLLLSNGTADTKLRSLYKAEATKSLERAEKIKAIKQDLTPVVKDELSPGDIILLHALCLIMTLTVWTLFRGADVRDSKVVTHQPRVFSALGLPRVANFFIGVG